MPHGCYHVTRERSVGSGLGPSPATQTLERFKQDVRWRFVSLCTVFRSGFQGQAERLALGKIVEPVERNRMELSDRGRGISRFTACAKRDCLLDVPLAHEIEDRSLVAARARPFQLRQILDDLREASAEVFVVRPPRPCQFVFLFWCVCVRARGGKKVGSVTIPDREKLEA